MYTHNYYKKIFTFYKKNLQLFKKRISSPHNYKKKIRLLNIRMVNQALNLSLNELRLIAEHRNISDYENKSAKDLTKALRGSRPRLGIKKNRLKEIKEGFYNLRHAFSEKDGNVKYRFLIKYRKLFYDIENYRHLSELEIEEIRKKCNKLEKSLNFKKPRNNINTIYYEE